MDDDLFLYHQESDVWASQSVYDNNEGLDYTVQVGEDGTYELMLAWPEGSRSCEDTDVEPAAVHAVVW